jgi:ribonucleoside-diphosphate reductase subunit M2
LESSNSEGDSTKPLVVIEVIKNDIVPIVIEDDDNLDLDLDEEILNESNKRFTIYPIYYKDIWKMYKTQIASFWVAEEIDFSKDYDDFQLLSKDEQHFLKMVLAFFAASDGIVNFNLAERFTKDIKVTEISVVYTYQMMMENIHGEVYSLMLDNIVRDNEEKDKLFSAINTIPSIKKMADWAFHWIQSPKRFAFRVIAFAVIEGVFFSGAFAAIFWFKKFNNHGKSFLRGLTKSNDFIARDEGQHTDFACKINSLLKHKLSSASVHNIVDEGVKISQEFMTDALPCRLIGMNNDMMRDYIEYVADRLLIDLGYAKKYNKKNPFPFMDTIGMPSKTNFFEERANEYSSSKIGNKSKNTQQTSSSSSTSSSKIVISDDF